MSDIFLSYVEEDREIARKFVRLLESEGWSVWWDRRIPSGRTWRYVLESALRDMRCMVVLWSRSSIDSHWVHEEAEEGRSQQVLIPVLIEPVMPPVGFQSIHAMDLSNWSGAIEAPDARQLIDDIRAFLGKIEVADVAERVATEGVGASITRADCIVKTAVMPTTVQEPIEIFRQALREISDDVRGRGFLFDSLMSSGKVVLEDVTRLRIEEDPNPPGGLYDHEEHKQVFRNWIEDSIDIRLLLARARCPVRDAPAHVQVVSRARTPSHQSECQFKYLRLKQPWKSVLHRGLFQARL